MCSSVDAVQGIEGENDFSGKRYVWLKDPQVAFVKGWIVEELGGGRILVQCDDGSVRLALGMVATKSGWLTKMIATRSRRRKCR
jgi:hypothetical protein